MSNDGQNILLVDDSQADRRFITRALEKCGRSFTIDSADTVASAQKKIAQNHYDCMLIDYRLPDADGLALVECVSTSDQGATGLVMISGEGSEAVAARAIRLGAHDYITKEKIDGNRLSAAIDKAIRSSKREYNKLQQQLMMENFASSAAHDLANPLNGVIGFITLAKSQLEAQRPDKVPEFLDNALTSAHYMQQLVVDLLHYARTGASPEACKPVDLTDVLETATTVMHEVIASSGGTIIAENLPTIEGYKTELVQLLQNLIGNSLKYRSHLAPVIEISAYRHGANSWCLSVADNGLGVPEGDRKKIFSPLYRVHRKNTSGAGLGLAICTKIMDLHHGRIWCEPREGGGTIFNCLMPERQPTAQNVDDLPDHLI